MSLISQSLQYHPICNFFFLLQSTLLSDLQAANHPILKFTQDRRVFRLLLLVGVILGVVSGSETGSSNTTQAEDLRIASVAIFLFLTVVQALQTGILATSSVSGMLHSSPLRSGLTNKPFSSTKSVLHPRQRFLRNPIRKLYPPYHLLFVDHSRDILDCDNYELCQTG